MILFFESFLWVKAKYMADYKNVSGDKIKSQNEN